MAELVVRDGDLHLLYNDASEKLKVFRGDGMLLFECDARNRTVVPKGFGKWAKCPRGNFRLGSPVHVVEIAFGNWFVPLLDIELKGPMKLFNRRGIGIHGGGSCSKKPFAPAQGWCPTHGCVRLQNKDLARLIAVMVTIRKAGGNVWITVQDK